MINQLPTWAIILLIFVCMIAWITLGFISPSTSDEIKRRRTIRNNRIYRNAFKKSK